MRRARVAAVPGAGPGGAAVRAAVFVPRCRVADHPTRAGAVRTHNRRAAAKCHGAGAGRRRSGGPFEGEAVGGEHGSGRCSCGGRRCHGSGQGTSPATPPTAPGRADRAGASAPRAGGASGAASPAPPASAPFSDREGRGAVILAARLIQVRVVAAAVGSERQGRPGAKRCVARCEGHWRWRYIELVARTTRLV